MKNAISPTPWTRDEWGHIQDANSQSVHLTNVALATGFVPEDDACHGNADLFFQAPKMLEVLQAMVKARDMGFAADEILQENSPIMDGARDVLRALGAA